MNLDKLKVKTDKLTDLATKESLEAWLAQHEDKVLAELNLTVRAQNSLKKAGFKMESEIKNYTVGDFKALGFSDKTIMELQEHFKPKEVTLGDLKEIVKLFESYPDNFIIKKAFGIKLIKC